MKEQMMKSLNLNDMGVSVVTPAEKAEKENIEKNGMPIEVVKPNKNKKENNTNKKPVNINLPKGTNNEGFTEYGEVITDVNKIAKIPIKKKVDPIDKTKNFFHNLAQKGIDRTKKELIQPGGVIDRAKREYIDQKYSELVKRAKTDKVLAEKIRKINNIILTDSNFDGISEIKRRGYIVFRIAKDEKEEVSEEFIEAKKRSIEQQKAANEILSKDDPNYTPIKIDDDFLNNVKKMENEKNNIVDVDDIINDPIDKLAERDKDPITGEYNKPAPIEEKISFEDEEDFEFDKPVENKIEEDTKEPEKEIENDIKENNEEKEDVVEDEDEFEYEEDDTDDEETEEEEEDIPEVDTKEIEKSYENQLKDVFSYCNSDDLSEFSVSKKIMKFSNKLTSSIENAKKPTVKWALQHTGVPIEITSMSGEELLSLSPEVTNMTTYSGLDKMFRTIYNHVVDKNKPSYDSWIKKVNYLDIDSLIFAVYLANFKNTNYVTYSCPSKKCKNIFLKEVNTDDMVLYPDKETEEKIQNILSKDTSITATTHLTKPTQISENYAISFCSPSIYSSMLEPMALGKENAEKYKFVLGITPVFGKLYYIDRKNKNLVPISFGTVEGSVEKTVLRKMKGIHKVIGELNADQRTSLFAKAYKATQPKDTKSIKYYLPETICPKCGHHIPADNESSILTMLFTRAQLATTAAILTEL